MTRKTASGLIPCTLFLAMLLSALPATSQISPGALSRSHRELEGARNCPACHQAHKGIDPERCLACHTMLGARIREGRGFHAQASYRACERCHVEHHGLEFELVWWGKEGIEAFAHEETGHRLEGAHVRASCRDCHHAANVRAAGVAMDPKGNLDLDRTFLGLGKECSNCHQGPHQDQFATRQCMSCHTQTGWKGAELFDHAQSEFPLTGRHGEVACARCHPSTGGAEPMVRYRGIRFASCRDCHRDEHEGRLGSECGRCHTTTGWNRVDSRRFEHDLTRFPLVGRHREAACDRCHGEGIAEPRPRFETCTSCHVDSHLAQFASRPGGAECADCHDEHGYAPSRFTVADHQKTRYPLEGRHREAACRACHRSVPTAELASWYPLSTSDSRRQPEVLQFRFRETGCTVCHANAHGTWPELASGFECFDCHDNSGWFSVSFDHAVTGYDLPPAHRGLECSACHTATEERHAALSFGSLSQACAGCHEDGHGGQFDRAAKAVACELCHVATTWHEATFDHNLSARFSLEGAHAEVACAQCHPTERIGGVPRVRYRPLATECSACHAGGVPEQRVATRDDRED